MGLLVKEMSRHQRINTIFSLVMIIIIVIFCIALMNSQIRIKISKFEMNWKQFFTEPYEILVFVFMDQTGIMFHTYEETRVNINPSQIVEILKEQCNAEIKDIATIIHNHPNPRRFTPGDNYVYNYFIERGFIGAFMIYYPHNDMTRTKKDG